MSPTFRQSINVETRSTTPYVCMKLRQVAVKMTAAPHTGRPQLFPSPIPVIQMHRLPSASESAAIHIGKAATETRPMSFAAHARGPGMRDHARRGCSPVSTR